jgi:hypothetical protein
VGLAALTARWPECERERIPTAHEAFPPCIFQSELKPAADPAATPAPYLARNALAASHVSLAYWLKSRRVAAEPAGIPASSSFA